MGYRMGIERVFTDQLMIIRVMEGRKRKSQTTMMVMMVGKEGKIIMCVHNINMIYAGLWERHPRDHTQ